jgi:hypothetical protein
MLEIIRRKLVKTRKGLVSNSSSSSFILFLNEIPQTEEETKELLFGNQKTFQSEWLDEVKEWETKDIAEIVFKDIRKENFVSREEVVQYLMNARSFENECECDDEINRSDGEEITRIQIRKKYKKKLRFEAEETFNQMPITEFRIDLSYGSRNMHYPSEEREIRYMMRLNSVFKKVDHMEIWG